MAKFRKKPVVIEAEQFWPDKTPYPAGVEVFVAGPFALNKKPGEFDFAIIKTLAGTMQVSPGDWAITGVQGERYPCKSDIFAATYEPVE